MLFSCEHFLIAVQLFAPCDFIALEGIKLASARRKCWCCQSKLIETREWKNAETRYAYPQFVSLPFNVFSISFIEAWSVLTAPLQVGPFIKQAHCTRSHSVTFADVKKKSPALFYSSLYKYSCWLFAELFNTWLCWCCLSDRSLMEWIKGGMKSPSLSVLTNYKWPFEERKVATEHDSELSENQSKVSVNKTWMPWRGEA